jgi:single-strand DNA-binding protein
MNYNKVILVGRLTRDPENKVLTSGQSLTSFGMATDRFFNDKSGQRQQQTEFHNIVLFGKLADIAVQYMNKGSLVLIEGRLQTRSWQDQNGVKKYRTEIIGERLQLGPKSARLSSQEAGPARNESRQEGQDKQEDIPVIEEEQEINIKDIPF